LLNIYNSNNYDQIHSYLDGLEKILDKREYEKALTIKSSKK
jgi:hypothetical protein